MIYTEIGIEIDKLTNSIENVISGDSFDTEVTPLKKDNLKSVTKKKGWLFNWAAELKKTDREVYKLTISGNPAVIQGLVSLTNMSDHLYVNLIENAPFNKGKDKLYKGVAGNLFAFACKHSWDKGYAGFVSFTAKTQLIDHYAKTLGAVPVGGQRMVIFPTEALKLIKKYFRTN